MVGWVEVGVGCEGRGVEECGTVSSNDKVVWAGGRVERAPAAVELAEGEERLRCGGAVKAHVHVVEGG